MSVPAIVLVAGEGSRLRPLTADRPKPMLPIAGRPALEWIVRWLRAHGICTLYFNLHYCSQAIVEHFGDGTAFGVQITYSYEPALRGTAGGAAHFRPRLQGTTLVIYGDVLSDLDLQALLARHRAAGAAVTLALYRVPDPWTRGVVEQAPEGWITGFREKPAPATCPPTALVNAGIYALEPAVLDLVPADRPSDFGHDLFPLLLARGERLLGWEAEGYIHDYGTLAQYYQADADARTGRLRLF
jgi:mannose-1-phosphate guanylyltransferase/phosphomannomutase